MSIKRLIGAAVLVLLGALIWLLWPVYGLVSNQNEVWRLPTGWTSLPPAAPGYSHVLDEEYGRAAAEVVALLESRRAALGLPSYSAAVAVRGEVVWTGGTGWASVEGERPVTDATTYRIGSTSKAVTATLLARMVANGTVDLDTPIRAYADLPNAAWEAMTLRQLASHTAGLPGYEDNTDWVGAYKSMTLRDRMATLEDALGLIDQSSVLFPPGEDFSYSSYDTLLIGYVLAEAAGRPYVDLMQQELTSVLELSSLMPDTAEDDRRATFYQARREGSSGIGDEPKIEKLKPWRPVDLSQKLPGGGWVTTPSDLVRIGSAWLDTDYLPEDVRDEFFTPVRIASGEVNPQNYALGWRRRVWDVPGVGEVLNLNHGGVSKGAQAWLMVLPEHDVVIAFTTNARTAQFASFSQVLDGIQSAFLPVAIRTAPGR